MSNIVTKICTKCGEEKEINDFYNDKTRGCGKNPWCKTCQKISNHKSGIVHKQERTTRNKKYYELHRDLLLDKNKAYRDSHKESICQMKKNWKLNNPEKVKAGHERYKAKNLDKMRLAIKKWRTAHKEKVLEYTRNRLAIKHKVGGTITSEEWISLCEKYGNKCLCCKRTDIKLTLDHIIPLKLGGRHSIENAQPLCQTCNSSKRLKVIDYR